MGFEARQRILALLKDAIKDNAEVRVVAFELNLPELIKLLVKIGPRLKIILDDSKSTSTLADGTKVTKDKGAPGSAESKAAVALLAAGAQVCRQHMGDLQHNKMIIVHGPTEKKVVLGSTNFSWRGFYVQSNNAVIVCGQAIVDQQLKAFRTPTGRARLASSPPPPRPTGCRCRCPASTPKFQCAPTRRPIRRKRESPRTWIQRHQACSTRWPFSGSPVGT